MSTLEPAPGRPAPAALGAGTMAEAFQVTAAQFGDAPALSAHGSERTWTWAQYADAVRTFAAGLAALGVGRGDVVCFMLTNRPEFNVGDAAALHLGAAGCSIYNTSSAEQISYILETARPKVVVTEQALCDQLLAGYSAQGCEAHVMVVDGEPVEGAMTMSDLESLEADGFDFDAAWRAVEPDDVLCLIYSSGTTGPPKGIELTHRNMLSLGRAMDDVYPFSPGGRTISFLPAAHVGDRCSTHYNAIFHGLSLVCLADAQELFACTAQVRPTVWGGVPRIWEKLKVAIEHMVESQDEATREKWGSALAVGLSRVAASQQGAVPAELEDRWRVADDEVFAPVRGMLGLAEVEVFAVGTAPTPVPVLEFFGAIGIEIAEMWGLTECSGIAAINPSGAVKHGTVGRPLPSVDVRIAEDGEILVRGPVVMPGYRDDPERTAEAIDDEGWLHTGDVGAFVDDGYLKIVDRKKELIINSSGKNMSPLNIESAIKAESSLIENAVAIGDRRPYNVALIVLDPTAARDDHLARVIGEAIERANARLARVEQIKRFKILDDHWQPGDDCLTPTAKLRRKSIAERYAVDIESLYA